MAIELYLVGDKKTAHQILFPESDHPADDPPSKPLSPEKHLAKKIYDRAQLEKQIKQSMKEASSDKPTEEFDMWLKEQGENPEAMYSGWYTLLWACWNRSG